jgi:hypothetical protein
LARRAADQEEGVVSGQPGSFPEGLPVEFSHVRFKHGPMVVPGVHAKRLTGEVIDVNAEADLRTGGGGPKFEAPCTGKQPDNRNAPSHTHPTLGGRGEQA